MAYFEEMWAQGYLFYAKPLYQVANRSLKTIEAALPSFLFPTIQMTEDEKVRLEKLRKDLAQFVFERHPKENSKIVSDYPSQTFEERAIEQEVESAALAKSEASQGKQSSTDAFVQDFPEYLPALEELEKKQLTQTELEDIVDTLYSVAVDIVLQFEDNRKRVSVFEDLFREQMFSQLLCKYDWVGYFKKGIQTRLKDYLL